MDNREKLKHLLKHWSEHNADHAQTYEEWSAKAEAFGNAELSQTLREIVTETKKLEDLFRKAGSLL